jgi:hypothetical protein
MGLGVCGWSLRMSVKTREISSTFSATSIVSKICPSQRTVASFCNICVLIFYCEGLLAHSTPPILGQPLFQLSEIPIYLQLPSISGSIHPQSQDAPRDLSVVETIIIEQILNKTGCEHRTELSWLRTGPRSRSL